MLRSSCSSLAGTVSVPEADFAWSFFFFHFGIVVLEIVSTFIIIIFALVLFCALWDLVEKA